MSNELPLQECMVDRVARAINSTAYATHEESWAKDKWPIFQPTARRAIAAALTLNDAEIDRITDLLMNHGCGDSDQCEKTARAIVEALKP